MTEDVSISPEDRIPVRKRRLLRRIVLAAALLLIVAVAFAWTQRTKIADDLIADMLADSAVQASYSVDDIGPTHQIISNIVVGDPSRPDLTIDRAEVTIAPRFGFPVIKNVRLVNLRLFGSYADGKLSFGALDPLVFSDSQEPFEFPDFSLELADARALVESEYGPVAIKMAGAGHLRSGFAAEMAATAPRIGFGGCALGQATIYGQISINAERPEFTGPLRFGEMQCADQGVRVAGGGIQLAVKGDRDLAGLAGKAGLKIGQIGQGSTSLATLSGTSDFSWRGDQLTAQYDVAAEGLASDMATATALSLEGGLRTLHGVERIELDGTLQGSGVRPSSRISVSLAGLAVQSSSTLFGPLIAKFERALSNESRNSSLSASFTARREDGRTSLTIPRASLRGRSGATLLALSRGQLTLHDNAVPLFSGNFMTGGQNLPRISGRMEQRGDAALEMRMNMAPYSAGSASLALPQLAVLQTKSGAISLSGRMLASGPLPGGKTRGLALPISGNWSPGGGLALWRGCTSVTFDALEVANLTFGKQSLNLCPPSGSAIVQYDQRGLRLAAGLTSLDVTGRLADTRLHLKTGPIGFAYPGAMSARNIAVELGPRETAARFRLADVSARLGDGPAGDITGAFSGTDVLLAGIPLNVLGASGKWRFANGRLMLSDAAFTVEDRVTPHRFKPLNCVGGEMVLENNVIRARAPLINPKSDREIANVNIVHNLATSAGYADLAVPGITFDKALQPVDLSRLALGVVANVDGVVSGSGRIDWTAEAVTSTGKFTSKSLDLAAAFGPVKGASGTVIFTDLLGMTTAPRQRIAIASVNPGIEIFEGNVDFQIINGEVIELQEAVWPFLGGTLTMRPVIMNIGKEEERTYILEITGLEAARFVERMQLNNLSATGTFDGTIPIIFDSMGNGRLENGLLVSRPPGGNIAYVGELTYEDMGAITNFAFDALRSLDYRQMTIGMEGPLTGELVTKVRFDGVNQGAGTSQNFITKRISKLPVRFLVNVRAPFYQLMTSLQAMYDPSAVRDPRDIGLIGSDGSTLARETDQHAVEDRDAAREAAEQAAAEAAANSSGDEPDIQPPESESVR